MEKQIVKFLDYEIVNTGNGDEWVLMKQNGKFWESHLGNYSNVVSAKEYAIHYFMVARPESFHAQIVARMNNSYIYHDYFAFIKILKNEGLDIPDGINSSEDGNLILTWNNKKI